MLRELADDELSERHRTIRGPILQRRNCRDTVDRLNLPLHLQRPA